MFGIEFFPFIFCKKLNRIVFKKILINWIRYFKNIEIELNRIMIIYIYPNKLDFFFQKTPQRFSLDIQNFHFLIFLKKRMRKIDYKEN